jgi:kynureninase
MRVTILWGGEAADRVLGARKLVESLARCFTLRAMSASPFSPAARERLRAEYQRFLRPGRILLSAHSHQAWPDAAREAQARYFDDAAEYVDDKWERAILPLLSRVGERILVRMGYPKTDRIAFGKSTHELLFRLITCLPLRTRPRIVTTSGEFHSMHRQLQRLAEEGVEVVWVDARDRVGLGERIAAAIDERTSLVAVSGVFFEDAALLDGLPLVLARAKARGALALVDAYHAFDVVPIATDADSFVVTGGYKYAQFGEGLCWLRLPSEIALRPIYTGWFAHFDSLAHERGTGALTAYDPSGFGFSGSTFDASAAYRAEAVLDVFDRHGLDVPTLRAISLAQTERILQWFSSSTLLGRGAVLKTPNAPERRAGFVSIELPDDLDASKLVAELRGRGVFVDSRGKRLRIGPAPYLTDDEIDRGLAILDDLVGTPPGTASPALS